MRVLVTGGAGFVGRRLVESLTADGADVAVFDTRGGAVALSRPVVFEGDVRDPEAVRAAFDRWHPALVYHLAAIHYIPECNAQPHVTWQTNVSGSENVLRAAMRHHAAVLFASSAAVYEPSHRPHSERSPIGPIDVYGRSKQAAERLFRELISPQDRVTIARLFNVYGRGDTTPHLIPQVVEQIRGGASDVVVGSFEAARDYIHVADVVSALRILGESDRPGLEIFNIGTGLETSVRHVVEACSSILRRPIGLAQDPQLIRAVDRMHMCADARALEEACGWKAVTTLTEGLADLLRPDQDAVADATA